MGDKAYTSITDMVRDLTNDAEIIDAVEQGVGRQHIIGQLMAMRAVRGMSQSDVADAMTCSQSRVSKMENSADNDVRYGDLQEYARAVGCELRCGVVPVDMEPAERVKCSASAVNSHLMRMAELAHEDEDIADAVTEFFLEALFNFSMIVGRAAGSLPKGRKFSVRMDLDGFTKAIPERPSARKIERKLTETANS